jgi:hypothetical protein
MDGIKLSEPQACLVKNIQAGCRLNFSDGLYRLRGTSGTRTVHPATVRSLLDAGVIERSLDGNCRLVASDGQDK